MDFYILYFEKEEKGEYDNPTIGLILCSDKNEIMAKYTLLSEAKNIFASKYKLYLPTEKELESKAQSMFKEKASMKVKTKRKIELEGIEKINKQKGKKTGKGTFH